MPTKRCNAVGQAPRDLQRHIICGIGDIDEIEPNTPYAGLIEQRELGVRNGLIDDRDAATGDGRCFYAC